MSLVEDAAQVAELQAMQTFGLELSVTSVSARVMHVARLPCELELRQPAWQPHTRDVG